MELVYIILSRYLIWTLVTSITEILRMEKTYDARVRRMMKPSRRDQYNIYAHKYNSIYILRVISGLNLNNLYIHKVILAHKTLTERLIICVEV